MGMIFLDHFVSFTFNFICYHCMWNSSTSNILNHCFIKCHHSSISCINVEFGIYYPLDYDICKHVLILLLQYVQSTTNNCYGSDTKVGYPCMQEESLGLNLNAFKVESFQHPLLSTSCILIIVCFHMIILISIQCSPWFLCSIVLDYSLDSPSPHFTLQAYAKGNGIVVWESWISPIKA